MTVPRVLLTLPTRDDLKKAHNQKKNSIWTTFLGKEDDDLETFMHLEQLKQKEDELKQLMIYCGRPGAA